MLLELAVKNYALIEETDISFGRGLNILTGETGAGKSILVGAMEMLLGSRASTDMIRTGAETATIQAIFSIKEQEKVKKKLEKIGIDFSGDELLLTREISRSGNNKVRINGQLTTLALFKEISPYLIDIHGQHEHQSLFSPDEQRNLLDELMRSDAIELRKETQRVFQELQDNKNKLNELIKNKKEREERLELLSFQIEELEKANLKKEEEEELISQHRVLSNAEKLFSGSKRIFSALSGEGMEVGYLEQIGHMMKEMEDLKRFDDNLQEPLNSIKNIYYQLQELTGQIQSYSDRIVFDEAQLQKIDERLGELNRLKRKYGPELGDVIDYHENIKEEYKQLKGSTEEFHDLKRKISDGEQRYVKLAQELSKMRKKSGEKFAKLLVEELKELAMPHTRFEVLVEAVEDEAGIEFPQGKFRPFQYGIDQVQFLISPNPGEAPKPLDRVASGGELSRIMLALKSIITNMEQVPTMIFDEVDTGIGGKTAHKVAEKLSRIADFRQVISITHLPQIAIMADEHFFISKEIEKNITRTHVRKLEDDNRIEEIARMLEGSSSETAISHARELMEQARNKKERV